MLLFAEEKSVDEVKTCCWLLQSVLCWVSWRSYAGGVVLCASEASYSCTCRHLCGTVRSVFNHSNFDIGGIALTGWQLVVRKVKDSHTRYRALSWSRCTGSQPAVINPAVGYYYFPTGLLLPSFCPEYDLNSRPVDHKSNALPIGVDSKQNSC